MVEDDYSIYQYTQLPPGEFIRLLELYPGHGSDTVECTLRQFELEGAPKYEALSYAWGNPTNKTSVLCDGKIIVVTPNLKHALHRLRYTHESRLIWADAICINQKNDTEKGAQVKMMAKIYGIATRVCVWLGSTTPQMEPAFELIDAIVRCTNASYDVELPSSTSHSWTALGAFFSAAWFSRLWIVQEVHGHACVVFCGEYEVKWKHIVLVAEFLLLPNRTDGVLNTYSDLPINAIAVLQIESAGQKPSTSGIFDDFRDFHCSDQRDKVYALLSFPPLCDFQPLIQPNYSKSVAEVYEEATVRIFEHCQNLGLLSCIEHDRVVDDEWPTWVPRWDRPRTTQILRNYASGRVRLWPLRIEHKPERLTSQGICISTISWCGKIVVEEVEKLTYDEAKSGPLKQNLLEWISKFRPAITHSNDPLILKLAMTLTVGLDCYSNCPPLDMSQFRLDFLAYLVDISPSLDILSITPDLAETLKAEGQMGSSSSFHYAAMRGCYNKRLFCTQDGAFGMGPRAAQIGDHIILLYGSNAPCILRKKELCYQFVGECYLHEHMHGEAIELAAGNLLVAEEFEIR